MIFLNKLRNQDIGFVTITSVKMSPDLRIAKVYISVLDRKKREAVFEKINSYNSYIRSELAHRIKIKFIPELKFFIDDTLDYVEKIEGLIKKIHEDDNKGNE